MPDRIHRNIVVIDEEKCNGCGLCVTGCAEGALAIIDGKAKLISETYCDGLGACLGECPQGAITVEQRVASAFDEQAVEKHLASLAIAAMPGHGIEIKQKPMPLQSAPSACPGSMVRKLNMSSVPSAAAHVADQSSELHNWPIQLALLPVNAPFLNHANLLIAADCVAFSLPNFQQRFLSGRVLTIGCPKLDDNGVYRRKLVEIFRQNEITSVQVVYMEVPCCGGLVRLVESALTEAGVTLPYKATCVGIEGDILAEN